jgi:dipeptidase E
MKIKQIIVMGGGGFSMEPDNLLLDNYILAQAQVSRPRVCFLPTASGENEDYIIRFYKAFTSMDARPSHLSFFQPHTRDMEDYLLNQDVIYVGGGNTKTMLAIWRDWEVDQILKRAYDRGIILAGLSAGAICWFNQGLTDSVPGCLGALECLGFLAGSCSPHYDSEIQRRPDFQRLIQQGKILPGYGIEDSAAIQFNDGAMTRVVCSVEGKQAYKVFEEGGKIVETALTADFLGDI